MRLRRVSLILFFATGCASQSSAASSPLVDGGGDSGTSSDSDAGSAPTCAGPTPTQSSDACQQCQDANCCISATAEETKPDVWTKSVGLICRQDNCATQCGAAASTCGNITPSPASCAPKLQAACCDELTACGNSDECLAIVYLCIDDQNCDPSASCFKACRAQYPEGAKIFDAMNACSAKVNCG